MTDTTTTGIVVAPDSSTGPSSSNNNSNNNKPQLINPHNPEFITKKPWYLSGDAAGGDTDTGPTLDHQIDQRPDKQKVILTLSATETILQQQRIRQKQQLVSGTYVVGQWVEALKKNKLPYRICQVVKVYNNNNNNNNNRKTQEVDLQYEDGTMERKVKVSNSAGRQVVRMTKTGNRSVVTELVQDGNKAIETYDGKRDQYHGYDRDTHNTKLATKYHHRLELRKQLKQQQQQQLEKQRKNNKAGGAGELGNDDTNDNDNNNKEKIEDIDSDFDDSDVESDHSDNDDDDDDDDDNDEFVQRDEDAKVITSRLARQGGVGGAQMKVTARNLRIREDTAKYLRNLDPESAYYDPKSRSMRDNPHPEIPIHETDYAGDNFIRHTGDVASLAQTQLFAWDATEKIGSTSSSTTTTTGGTVWNHTNDNGPTGIDILHPQANPSQAELLKKQFQTKMIDAKIQQKRTVLDKYGGTEYLDGTDGLGSVLLTKRSKLSTNNNDKDDEVIITNTTTTRNKDEIATQQQQQQQEASTIDRNLRFGVSTEQEQYSSHDGRLLHKGNQVLLQKHHNNNNQKPRQPLPCKYQEDIYMNGHTTVWGSYFDTKAFRWGYADDHSLLRNSYCTGRTGRIANDESHRKEYGS